MFSTLYVKAVIAMSLELAMIVFTLGFFLFFPMLVVGDIEAVSTLIGLVLMSACVGFVIQTLVGFAADEKYLRETICYGWWTVRYANPPALIIWLIRGIVLELSILRRPPRQKYRGL